MPEDCTDPELAESYAALLSIDERTRLGRRRTAKLRHDYLVGRALLRTTLSRYRAVDPRDWVFRRNEHGRPEIERPAACGLRFNLSDTDGLITCAATEERAIGVDVESRDRRVRPLAVAERFFDPMEVGALRDLAPQAQATRFLEYWTLKESYIKAVGRGFSLPIRQVAFSLETNGSIAVSFAPDLRDDPQRWIFRLLQPTPRHQLALALERTSDGDAAVRLCHTVPLRSDETAGSPGEG